MKSFKKKDERLLNILRRAYQEKERLEVGNRWQEEVMPRIRKMRSHEATPSSSMVFLQFVWKLAPVTVLLILVLSAFLIGSGLTSGYGVFDSDFEGVGEVTLTEMIAT